MVDIPYLSSLSAENKTLLSASVIVAVVEYAFYKKSMKASVMSGAMAGGAAYAGSMLAKQF